MKKPKFSPFYIIPPLVFLALGSVFFFGMQRENPDQLTSALVGFSTPKIQEVALADYPQFKNDMLLDDEVKLVNFWASWCPPCRLEHDTLLALSERGIKIYGVNFKDRPENGIEFLEEEGSPFTAITVDREGRAGLDWGVAGLPETFIIGRDGKILYRFAGPLIAENYTLRFLPELEKALQLSAVD